MTEPWICLLYTSSYIPAPEGDPEADTQLLISTIDYNEYVGRIGIGKIDNGSLRVNQDCVIVNHHDMDKRRRVKIGKLYEFDGQMCIRDRCSAASKGNPQKTVNKI